MTITPGHWHFNIYQGATFTYLITWKDENGTPINLTGYTAEFQVRWNAADIDPIIELTSSNGGITLGGIAGTIQLFMHADDTAALNAGVGVYDLKLTAPGINPDQNFLIEGSIVIQQMVTR